MKKVLVVLVVAVAMLLVGCPQPTGNEEMVISSIDIVSNGQSMVEMLKKAVSLGENAAEFLEEPSFLAGIQILFPSKTVNVKWENNSIVLDPAITVSKTDFEKALKEGNEIEGDEVTYKFENGKLILSITYTITET